MTHKEWVAGRIQFDIRVTNIDPLTFEITYRQQSVWFVQKGADGSLEITDSEVDENDRTPNKNTVLSAVKIYAKRRSL